MIHRSLVLAALACACTPRPPATTTPERPEEPRGTVTEPPAARPEPGDVEEPVTFTGEPLLGPFESIAVYCARLARETGKRSAEDGEGALQTCLDGQGARLPGPAPAGAALRDARVLRIATAPFGAPLERCRWHNRSDAERDHASPA